MQETHETAAERLVDHRRFDIPAKTLYVFHQENHIACQFASELYREHIRVWNGFYEREPRKNSFDDYQEAFDSIINAVRDGHMDFNRSPVSVSPSGQLFNGGHRVAAAWSFARPVRFHLADRNPIDEYNWRFFADRRRHVPTGLGTRYMDAIALEFLRLKGDQLSVAVFWPVADFEHERSEAILRRHADIFYRKYVQIDQGEATIRNVYAGEPWCDVPNSVQAKVNHCFGGGGNLRVYLLDRVKGEGLSACKAELRSLYGLGKHSVHISDTPAETRRAATMFFNENSNQLLRVALTRTPLPTFERLLHDLLCRCEALGVNIESICLSGSATLAAHGVRDVRDLDFLQAGHALDIPICSGELGLHNDYVRKYGIEPDDIIYDPHNHFYYRGVKIIALPIWKRVMEQRAEVKDRRDLKSLADVGL